MTLVIVLNALLVVLVLGTIVGLHAWAILSSQSRQPAVAPVRPRHVAPRPQNPGVANIEPSVRARWRARLVPRRPAQGWGP